MGKELRNNEEKEKQKQQQQPAACYLEALLNPEGILHGFSNDCETWGSVIEQK